MGLAEHSTRLYVCYSCSVFFFFSKVCACTYKIGASGERERKSDRLASYRANSLHCDGPILFILPYVILPRVPFLALQHGWFGTPCHSWFGILDNERD